MTAVHADYDELLVALYQGTIPRSVPAFAVPRFRAESLRRRLHVSARIRAAYPRAGFYGQALLGETYLDGVCRELVLRSGWGGASLLATVEEAARKWASKLEDARVRALFEYDDLVLRGAPYVGPDKDRIQAAAGLPNAFALGRFDYDMVAFGQHVDLLVASHAPPSLVQEYVPIPRRQALAVFQMAEGAGQVVVRDVMSKIGESGDC